MDENKQDVEFTEGACDEKQCCSKDEKACCAKKCASPLSIFTLGLLAVVFSLWNSVFAPLGFVLGLIAVIKGHKARHLESVPGLSTAGWVMAIVSMVISGISLVYAICTFSFFAFPYHHVFYRTFWF